MPKYLIQGSYTEEGLKGLLKEGGSKRREATEQVLKAIGGTLEAYYFAFGDNDYYVLVDLPDNVNATAVALVGNASGAIKNKTTVLITPEEVDQALRILQNRTGQHRPGEPPDRTSEVAVGDRVAFSVHEKRNDGIMDALK